MLMPSVQQNAYSSSKSYSLEENSCSLLAVPASVSLRCHATCPHSQETEQPADDIHHHRANGYGSNIRGIAHVADYGNIDKTKQRHRDIGDDGRNGK